MDIMALYDRKGRILAAVQVQATEAGGGGAPTPQPEPKRGQRVGEFTVPREYAHLSFSEACGELMVMTRGKHATLESRPPQRRGICAAKRHTRRR